MTETDLRRERGRRSRTRLLARAAAVASEEGLDALSLARLATDLGMSKSGVAALYPDKLTLQLAVVEHARGVFVDEVVRPAFRATPGIERLNALIDCWIDYIRRAVFPGGCFVQHCLAEQARRNGPLRDTLTAAADQWIGLLAAEIRQAVDSGHATSTDVDQTAFELEAMLAAGHRGHAASRIDALDRAADGCRARIAGLASAAGHPEPAPPHHPSAPSGSR